MSIAIIGRERNRLLQVPDGRLRSAQLVQRESQVVVGARVVRFEVEKLLVLFDCRLEIPLLVGDHAQQ